MAVSSPLSSRGVTPEDPGRLVLHVCDRLRMLLEELFCAVHVMTHRKIYTQKEIRGTQVRHNGYRKHIREARSVLHFERPRVCKLPPAGAKETVVSEDYACQRVRALTAKEQFART